jgi:TIR domain-containing protein
MTIEPLPQGEQTTQGPVKPRIFISYEREDARNFVAELARDLQDEYDVLYDDQLEPGLAWQHQLEGMIRSSKVFIFVLTPRAVRYASDSEGDGRDSVCHNELSAASGAKIPLVPIRLLPSRTPLILEGLHHLDFTTLSRAGALRRLRRRIADVLAGKRVPPGRGLAASWSLAGKFQPILDDRRSFFHGREWLFKAIDARSTHAPADERMALITGGPGTGKSAIVARLIELKSGRVLAYHCCRGGVGQTLEAHGFVRNLAYMLNQSLADYSQLLAQMAGELQRLDDATTEDQSIDFFDTIILHPLQQINKPVELGDGPGWVLIDALDESEPKRRSDPVDGAAKTSIVDLLVHGLHRLPKWLRIMATSRPGALSKRLTGHVENGIAVVHELRLAGADQIGDTRAYLDARIADAELHFADDHKVELVKRSAGNFLLVKLLIDSICAGHLDPADPRSLPEDLHDFYHREFRRLHPDPQSPAFRTIVRPLIAAAVTAKAPLSAGALALATGARQDELHVELTRLSDYLIDQDGRYSWFHKSLVEWLLDRNAAGEYVVFERDGHERLANLCSGCLDDPRVRRRGDVFAFEGEEVPEYFVRCAIDHCIGAGRLPQAVEALHFIFTGWDEQKANESTFQDVSPGKLRRQVLLALNSCSRAKREQIDPHMLAELLQDFYQIEPLYGPIEILVWEHREAWPAILKKFLARENYVVRVAISEVLADVCTKRETPITADEIHAYLDSDDVNLRELAAYALRHLYSKAPERYVRPGYLDRLGESETYAGRSALGDLLLTLSLQDKSHTKQVTSRTFWQPIWDHNRIDVCDLKAIDLIAQRADPPPDTDAETHAAYTAFQQTLALRRNLVEMPEIKSRPKLARMIEDYVGLGSNLASIRAGADGLAGCPLLPDVMRLLFSHALWDVAETAASVLTSFVEADSKKAAIVADLFGDASWRVRFGAIETAYQLAAVDRMQLFGEAVRRFYKYPVCRVRALCAENLISHILERPAYLRGKYLEEFAEPIARWVRDDDCWVLEHVFRLIKRTEQDGGDTSSFFRGGTPHLLEGLGDWGNLPRETFLLHIEARKRMQTH